MLRKLLIVVILSSTSSCVTFTSLPSPVSTPTPALSPIDVPVNTTLPTSTRERTLEPTTSVQRAVADLASRLNIDAQEITVDALTSIEIVIPDTVCVPDQNPQPSIPAQVVGQEIILSVRNQTYIYHARGAEVTLCTAQSN